MGERHFGPLIKGTDILENVYLFYKIKMGIFKTSYTDSTVSCPGCIDIFEGKNAKSKSDSDGTNGVNLVTHYL